MGSRWRTKDQSFRQLSWINDTGKGAKSDRDLWLVFDFGRGLGDRLCKADTFLLLFFLCLFLGRFREDLGPFLFLLNLPSTFLPFPMGSPIVPEMKVNIKVGGDDTAKIIDIESNILGENRKAKMIVAQKFDVKIHSSTPQT